MLFTLAISKHVSSILKRFLSTMVLSFLAVIDWPSAMSFVLAIISFVIYPCVEPIGILQILLLIGE